MLEVYHRRRGARSLSASDVILSVHTLTETRTRLSDSSCRLKSGMPKMSQLPAPDRRVLSLHSTLGTDLVELKCCTLYYPVSKDGMTLVFSHGLTGREFFFHSISRTANQMHSPLNQTKNCTTLPSLACSRTTRLAQPFEIFGSSTFPTTANQRFSTATRSMRAKQLVKECAVRSVRLQHTLAMLTSLKSHG